MSAPTPAAAVTAEPAASNATPAAAAAAAAPSSSETAAAAPKLSAKAKPFVFKTDAPAFVPGGAAAAAAPPAAAAASKPNPKAPAFNPKASSFNPSAAAPAFNPGAPTFNPQSNYRAAPVAGPVMMGGPYVIPGQAPIPMMMNQYGQWVPMYPQMIPGAFPPAFIPNMMPQQQQQFQQQQFQQQQHFQQMQHQQQQQQQQQQGQHQANNAAQAQTAQTAAPASAKPSPAANAPLLASPAPHTHAAAAPSAQPAANHTAPTANTNHVSAAAAVAAGMKKEPAAAPAAAAKPAPEAAKKPAADAAAATPAPAAAAAAAPAAAAPAAAKPVSSSAAQALGVAPLESRWVRAGKSTGAPVQPKKEEAKEEAPKPKEQPKEAAPAAAAKPAVAAAAAPAKPAAGTAAAIVASSASKPAPIKTAPAAAAPAAIASPVTSPGSRKQSAAEAEDALGTSISSAAAEKNRKYDRDFLLQFQQINMAIPEGLSGDIDAILKGSNAPGGMPTGTGDFRPQSGGLRPGALRPGQQGAPSRIRAPAGVPASAGAGGKDRAAFGSGALPARPNQPSGGQGNKGKGGGKNQVSAPMDIEIVPLTVSENRYRPLKDVPGDVKLLRSLNAILNKLTPEKFDTLVDQVMDLNISDAGLLRDVVTAVFEKALAEPNYSPVYAEFCVKLSAKLPSFPADEDDKNNTHNFKRLVLNQCQQEFESDQSVAAEASEATAEDKEALLAKQKRRTLGTIRFIGEMFVRGMLAAKIMKSCLIMLMGDVGNPNEEDIEALCKLLETVGSKMDISNDPKIKSVHVEFMNDVFSQLETLAMPPSKADREKTEEGNPVLSSRLRFMIQDTMDLRRKNWVVRRKNEVNAKKISDVHKDAAGGGQDVRGSSSNASSSVVRPMATLPAGGSRFGKKSDRYSVNVPLSPSPRPNKQSDDGWETAGNAKGKNRSQDVRGGAASSTALGRANSGTASGAASGAPTPRGAGPATPQKRDDGKNNAFALLHGDEEHEDAAAPRSEAGDDEAAADEEEDGADEDESASSKVDPEVVSKKISSFLKEYFASGDFAEVKQCIEELGGKSALGDLVYDGLMLVIDLKENERKSFAQLLPMLFADNYLTAPQIEQGFARVLELAEDMGMDIPLFVSIVGNVLAELIVKDVLTVGILQRLADSLTAPDDQAKFPAYVLISLKKSKGEEALLQMIQTAGIKWADIDASSKGQTNEEIKKKLAEKRVDGASSLIGVL